MLPGIVASSSSEKEAPRIFIRCISQIVNLTLIVQLHSSGDLFTQNCNDSNESDSLQEPVMDAKASESFSLFCRIRRANDSGPFSILQKRRIDLHSK